ncbi:hydrolase [Spirobacillus cienkowskii]|uniref:hydrolase n=1 Tax=Spirobacillus cienkowskii TaxID=495820 RepID=UPI0030CFD5A3
MAHFKPAWWLNNKHLQTLFPVLLPQKLNLNLVREFLELPDGDFLVLDWTSNKQENLPLIVVLHGLEGSSDSYYIKRIMSAAQKNNFRAVCMHFRGCPNFNKKIKILKTYHAGQTADVQFFLNFLIKKLKISQPIFAVGFSLGANVLLKLLGEYKEEIFIKAAVAVSVPFDLSLSADRMNTGFSKIYQWWLLRSLKKKLKLNNIFKDLEISELELKKIKSFWQFDDKVTAKLNGFINVHDYYKKSSSKQYLKFIKTSTLIIHSIDDPFLYPQGIPNVNDVSASVELEITSAGGHVGFVTGNIPFFPKFWLEQRIVQYFTQSK